MTKILIVDDESLVRRGLESMIPWDRLDCQLVGQAQNGEEGLQKIRELKPDLVFTDVKMPKMDGLQMIRTAAQENLHPVFVILSGYNEFELVRQAMKLGAADYLMKLNLEESELCRLIQDIQQKLQSQAHYSTAAEPPVHDFKKNFIHEMLHMEPVLRSQMPPQFELKENHFYRVLFLRLQPDGDSRSETSDFSQNFLLTLCKEHLPEELEVYAYSLDDDCFALYVESMQIFPPAQIAESLKRISEGIKRYLNRKMMSGVSAPHRNIMHLAVAKEEAKQCLSYRVSGAGTTIHFFTDMLNENTIKEQLAKLKNANDFFDTAENLLLQMQKFVTQRTSSIEDSRELCRLLISQIYGFDPKCREFFVGWFGREYSSASDFSRADVSALSSWLLRLSDGVSQYNQQFVTEIYRFKVKKAKEYIYENRFQKISLNDVADALEITPNYLSRIFKRVTQKSFSDYIAEIKIKEAKSLLLQDNNRIYEVSSMLGYDDPYYFSKVFKKVTQMTPSEYIARQ